MRILILVAAAVLLPGCISRVSREDVQGRGHALFNGYLNPKADCYRCHNGDAQGSLFGPELQATSDFTDAQIVEEIDEGPGIMPSFRDALTAEEKALIVDWLRQRFPPETK